jgi:hypothetical protein
MPVSVYAISGSNLASVLSVSVDGGSVVERFLGGGDEGAAADAE